VMSFSYSQYKTTIGSPSNKILFTSSLSDFFTIPTNLNWHTSCKFKNCNWIQASSTICSTIAATNPII
jgi:hypothetical protein